MTERKVIKVLVVDDSSFMRKAIKGMLEEDPGIKVVDTARDGAEAIEKIEALAPDVVTLDVEMPRMNGIEALRVIMERHPLPVLMVSSLTEEGAKATFEALDIGALDYIPKQLEDLSFNIVKIKAELIDKVKAVAGRGLRRRSPTTPAAAFLNKKETAARPSCARFASQRIAIVAIGASTGGPRAVQDVLCALPGDFHAGVLVVQHMPRNFTAPYAERLNGLCKLRVREAREGDVITPGEVLVAPGGTQTRLKRKGAIEVGLVMEDSPGDAIYKPSVDISLTSVAGCFPDRAVGVILTGMGSDGREGMRAIKKAGGKVVAQDEASCVVYGMPKAVVDAGLADKVAPLDAIAGEVLNMV
ncbi:MAG: chemotaxis response regulator protein-glutamate methylesterase [Deltaproteobacteria bacterium]|nr:chemotaxis response regulator protein-glutamate methylesterase [Deltaproteobacteria bacterium]